MCPDTFAAVGAVARRGARGTASPQSPSCRGAGDVLGETPVSPSRLPVCSLSQQLPASSLALSFMSFIRSVRFQRVVKPQ